MSGRGKRRCGEPRWSPSLGARGCDAGLMDTCSTRLNDGYGQGMAATAGDQLRLGFYRASSD